MHSHSCGDLGLNQFGNGLVRYRLFGSAVACLIDGGWTSLLWALGITIPVLEKEVKPNNVNNMIPKKINTKKLLGFRFV